MDYSYNYVKGTVGLFVGQVVVCGTHGSPPIKKSLVETILWALLFQLPVLQA